MRMHVRGPGVAGGRGKGRGGRGPRGRPPGQGGGAYYYKHAQDSAAPHGNTCAVDPARAKQVLWSWLQRVQKANRPAEHVSLDPCRGRKGHSCTAWVWLNGQWTPYEAAGWYSSRTDAVAAAYASAVEGLGVPVPPDCVLSEEAQAQQQARGLEERKRALAAEQRAQAVTDAMHDLEADISKALFADAAQEQDGFCTPRESEDEAMPAPLPPRLPLPAPVEAKPGDDRGNKSVQQIKQLVKREPQLLQGPSTHEVQRPAPGGAIHVCAYTLLFDRSVAIIGIAWGSKRAAVRAAAASACVARLDTAASLPSREESGPHASTVVEIRRLQQLQPFKLWAFQGVQLNENLRWYAALWGQVPFQGSLRDFWGEGIAEDRSLAVANSCAEAATQLTRMLGSDDCVKWLNAMARVTMEVEEVPVQTQNIISDSEASENLKEYDTKLQKWLADRFENSEDAAEPPDLTAGPAPTVPQVYEPEQEGGPMEQAKVGRGVPLLPVRELRPQLAETLGDCCCLVVSGGTGSGKSTQIPQYIIDDFRPDNAIDLPSENCDEELLAWRGPARVIVTEPRRIAAVSLAERVAWERGEPLGQSVGYSVRGDSKHPRGRNGTIEFCTVGILLRRLQQDPWLQRVSHVLVDEVHERDLMTDFLLILLKELLCLRSDLRVILMSATLDVRTFSNYLWQCPCLEIPTGPRYDVEEIHLEDTLFGERWATDIAQQLLAREAEARRAVEEAKEADDEADAEGNDEPAYRASTGIWWGSAENDEMYLDLLTRVIIHLGQGPALVDDNDVPGSVLCFLPGWAEIKTCVDRLQEMDRQRQLLWVLPLHSTLPKAEQQLIFKRPPAGKTKVILSTNIAESSVTIDDVVVVVDCGLMREVSYDPVRRLSTLETVWVSQSSAIQRMGRAGRVRKGRCFRFYSRAQLEQAPWRTAPEMQRCELSSTCLQAMALHREVRDFLGRAPDPPTLAAVETAMEELLQLGAVCPGDGQNGMREIMMPLGEALSRMTLSPKLARMLILGALFGVSKDACLLAAVIAAPRRIFACPLGRKKESLACVRGFSTTSDLLAAFSAVKDYEGWKNARSEQHADRWAGELFLVPKRMKQLLSARDMHVEELQRAGLSTGSAGGDGAGSTHRQRHGWSSWDGAEDSREVWSDAHEGSTSPGDGSLEESGSGEDDREKRQANEMELMKALLVAAYPQNVALRRRIGLAKHNTATGLEAIIAPQSVNAPPKAKSSSSSAVPKSEERQASWWSYGQMHISNRQGFLRATTLVDPYHVALFGGLTTVEDDYGSLRELDGWIELRGPRATLRAVAKLRATMSRCIHLCTLESRATLSKGVKAVLDEIVSLLGTASARQERVASCLPESPAQYVEKPPPPSEWPTQQSYGSRGSNWDRKWWNEGGTGTSAGKGSSSTNEFRGNHGTQKSLGTKGADSRREPERTWEESHSWGADTRWEAQVWDTAGWNEVGVIDNTWTNTAYPDWGASESWNQEFDGGAGYGHHQGCSQSIQADSSGWDAGWNQHRSEGSWVGHKSRWNVKDASMAGVRDSG